MRYVVIDKYGAFVGYPSEDLNVARILATRKPGRRVYALTENRETETINSVLESFEEVEETIECPTTEYDCPYYKKGLCTLENAEMECDAFYSEE